MTALNTTSRTLARANLLPVGGVRDPLSLTNCIGWWDFSDAQYLSTATNGIGAVTNGAQIAYCFDRSGNGRHLTQATAGNRPTWNSTGINSLGAGSFVNASQCSITGSLGSSLTGDAEVTMFFVSTRTNTSTGGAQGMILWTGNQISCADGFGNRSRFTTAGVDNSTTVAPTAVLTATIQTFAVLSGGANLWRFWRNGTSIAPVTAFVSGVPRAISSPAFSLGVVGNIGFHNGLISEVVLYSRALSATEVVSMNRYLGSKWNITVA
jgi:hypothetical protein